MIDPHLAHCVNAQITYSRDFGTTGRREGGLGNNGCSVLDDQMRFTHLYLVLSIFLFVGVATPGQEPSAAVLVDEHGSLPCDDTLGRLDLFFSELSKDSGYTGLVVLSAPVEKKRVSVFRQFLIQAHTTDREFTSKEIKYVRTNFGNEFHVQLWRLPAGATEPPIEYVDMSFSLPNDIRPFNLATEYEIEDLICPGVNGQSVFAEFIKGNPSARENVVVRDRTVEGAKRYGIKILRIFQKKYGIPRSLLRLFPRKSANPSNNSEPIVEYWYLP